MASDHGVEVVDGVFTSIEKKKGEKKKGHFYVPSFFVGFSISRRIPEYSAFIRPLNRPIKVPGVAASRAKYRATSLRVERSRSNLRL
jgi:hypothetical protein